MELIQDYIYLVSGIFITIGSVVLEHKQRSISTKFSLLGVFLVWIGLGIATIGPSSKEYIAKFEDGSTAVLMDYNLAGTYAFSFGFIFFCGGFLGHTLSLKTKHHSKFWQKKIGK